MDSVNLKAYAKINLSLDVVGKRPDGYHNVKMIMQSVNLYDTITLTLTDRDINITCSCNNIPLNNKNLAYKAADLYFKELGYRGGVNIEIIKRIPVAAGLAGGSADAAAVLTGLDQLMGSVLGKNRLCILGRQLGADVPYCIMGGTMLAEGIGDVLTPLPGLPDLNIIIIKPPVGVSTPWVYQNLKLDEVVRHPDIELIIKAIKDKDVLLLSHNMCNVLETVTIKEYAIIQTIKDKLIELGAAGSLMSGSGPSVFGIFLDRKSAETAWERLDRQGLDCFLINTL